jgi:ArsR family transcriptional regulator
MNTTSELLKIVGNETRRKILSLLSEEPHYILQLSTKLNVTQPAILKHLDILEKIGLIESFEKKSKRGANRKYYKIHDDINLEIVIGPKDFKVIRHLPEKGCTKYLSSKERMEQLTNEINRAEDISVKAAKALELIEEADALLSCSEYSRSDHQCMECRRIASLKRRASEIIIQVSKGDAVKGLQMLSEMLRQII